MLSVNRAESLTLAELGAEFAIIFARGLVRAMSAEVCPIDGKGQVDVGPEVCLPLLKSRIGASDAVSNLDFVRILDTTARVGEVLSANGAAD